MPNIIITENSNCDTCYQPTVNCQCIPNSNCVTSSPTVLTGCPINLDTDCVFYNKLGLTASLLNNLNIPNGTTLKTILEAVDTALGFILPFTFPAYTSACINYNGYVINSMTTFLTSVDNEFCKVKNSIGTLYTNVDTYINNLTTSVDIINHPQITEACGLGFTVTDTLKDLIIKLKDGFCSLQATNFSDTSPAFSPVNSASIFWVTGGTKGHSPIANIKKSAFAGNNIQILSDGLYVGDVLPSTQTLSYNSGTRVISLSNGGGTITLPVDNDNQTLSLDSINKRLSISGGNFIDLTSVIGSFLQTAITPNNTPAITLSATGPSNTNLTATLQLSTNAGNAASIVADGLYISQNNDKVKASSSGTTNGYLIDKLNVVNASLPLTLGFAYNATSDKVDLTATLDETILLNDIFINNTLGTSLYNIVASKMCFRFKIRNTDGSASTYSYQDCAGTIFSLIAISAGSTVTIFAKGVISSNDLVLVYNLGLNF